MGLGSSKLTLDLMDVKDWDEIVSMVAAAAKQAKPGDWILGRGWHQEKWSSVPKPNVEGFPIHDALSKVSPNNPVMLTHASGHATFVNAKAMAAANLTRTTANPSGGEILKDSTGRPIGLLRETASGIVSRAYETWRSAKTAAERDSQSIGEVMPSILLRDKYRRPLTEVYFPWRRLQVLALDSGGLGAPAIDSSDDRRCRLANCFRDCLTTIAF